MVANFVYRYEKSHVVQVFPKMQVMYRSVCKSVYKNYDKIVVKCPLFNLIIANIMCSLVKEPNLAHRIVRQIRMFCHPYRPYRSKENPIVKH